MTAVDGEKRVFALKNYERYGRITKSKNERNGVVVMDPSYSLLVSFISGLFWSLIWGFATAAVRDKKGYGRNWFWFGFFLGLVPFIIACAIPAKQDPFQTYPPGELERLLAGQKTGETGQSQFSNEDYVKKTVAAGGWQCSCGRANPAYASTCACGLNKRQSDHSVGYAAKAAERTQQQQALEAELKKYRVMLDSQIITQEQYEAKVRELYNKR